MIADRIWQHPIYRNRGYWSQESFETGTVNF